MPSLRTNSAFVGQHFSAPGDRHMSIAESAPAQERTWPVTIYVVFILLLIFLLNLHPLMTQSITTDESPIYGYGRQVLLDHTTARSRYLYNYKMTINALNVLPEWLLTNITWTPIKAIVDTYLIPYRFILLGRLVTVFFSLLLALAVYSFAKTLYGQGAGLFSLTLYAFSPNILAHSNLVTSDFYVTCFIFVAIWRFQRYLNAPTRLNLLLSASTLGLAQLTKYTAVHLFPIFFLLLVVVKGKTFLCHLRERKNIGALISIVLAHSACFIVLTILIINAGFLFENVFVPFKDYPLKSHFFTSLKPLADNIPVPFPFAYLHGLDWIIYDEESGTDVFNLYLFGELQTAHKTGWWYYYIVAFLLKSTLGFLALLGLSVFVTRRLKTATLANEMFLMLPVAYFFVYFSLFFHTQIGLRFILPVYPLLFVFIGKVASYPSAMLKRASMLLLGAHAISALSYHPHYLSYFNELIGERKNSYQYLADSNIDWNQNEKYLRSYLDEHRGLNIKMSPNGVTSGRIIVSVNELVGVFDAEKYRWLRENYKPVGHVAYSYLIYEVPERPRAQ